MSTELSRLKSALDAWIAENPSKRKYQTITAAQASEILRRAEKLKQIVAPHVAQSFEHYT